AIRRDPLLAVMGRPFPFSAGNAANFLTQRVVSSYIAHEGQSSQGANLANRSPHSIPASKVLPSRCGRSRGHPRAAELAAVPIPPPCSEGNLQRGQCEGDKFQA